MENQDIDLLGQTVGNLPYKIGIIDQNGNLKNQFVAKASTNRIDIPEQFLSGGSSTGGSTGGNTGGGNSGSTSGGTNPTSAGADYYAGSLANGEITQRNFEWGGTDNPTQSNIITFKDPQGSKFNGMYDGIQLLGHIQKTVITNGVAGAVTKLPLNYDTNNAAKAGYYTTSASYPVYINNSSFSVGSNTSVSIIGIGENLGGKNIEAPSISLTLNSDMTLTLTHEKGYNNDGASPATGVEYQFVVDTISTYSFQAPVSQLPSTVNLFTGSSFGNVLLAGPTTYHENAANGYLITLSNQTLTVSPEIMLDPNFDGVYWPDGADQFHIDLSSVGLIVIKIPKEELIINNSFDVSNQLLPYVGKVVQGQYHSNDQWTTIHYSFSIVSFEGSVINILPNKTISLNLTVQVKEQTSDKFNHIEFPIPVIRVNPYQN